MKKPPSFFFLLLSLWVLQQTAATSSISTPAHSSATDTTLVWRSVLKVNVTPVPAMPITREMTPKGNTHRYQDFSVPPVAWARRSSVGRVSGGLGSRSLPELPFSPSSSSSSSSPPLSSSSPTAPSPIPFISWFWFSESWGKVLVSLRSKSGWKTEAGGWRPEEQPILEWNNLRTAGLIFMTLQEVPLKSFWVWVPEVVLLLLLLLPLLLHSTKHLPLVCNVRLEKRNERSWKKDSEKNEVWRGGSTNLCANSSVLQR